MENSLGQEIQNPESFKKWFGSSITVDEKGRPLVLYHGTKQRFDTFKPKYTDGLIFFAYNKQFSLDWGGNLSAEQEEKKKEVNEPIRKTQNSIAKWYQNKYGSADTWSDEIWKEYEKQIKHLETQAHHKADIDTKIMPVYLKVTKIFYPEKDYELVLDDIIDYYDFPRTAPDHSKEIEELKKEADKLADNFKKSGRNKVSDEEYDAMEEIQSKINSLIREQNAVKRFEEYDLKRIQKGAWIYFEHKEIIDKIWSLGYDAIELSERNGEPSTLAVRSGNNQIKSIFNKGTWDSSDNIYENVSSTRKDITIITTEEQLLDYLKEKKKPQKIIYDSKKDWYIVSYNVFYSYNELIKQIYELGYYNNIDIQNYIKDGINIVNKNVQPKYLFLFYYSPQENLQKSLLNEMDYGYVYKNFGTIYTKGFKINRILDLGRPLELKENYTYYNNLNQNIYKILSKKLDKFL